jgi:hypothetical protein
VHPVTPRACALTPARAGVLLAYSFYSPTYAATSTYISGTFRANPTALGAGMLAWLVRPPPLLTTTRGVLTERAVLRALEPACAPDGARAAAAGEPRARGPARVRVRARQLPELHVRGARLGGPRRAVRQLRRCVRP